MFANTSRTTSHQILNQCPPMSRPLLMIDGGAQQPPPKWSCNGGAELAPNCPRCASSNTKFCYYNNYSLSQPRYFCKGCRRYWTKGGSLRNVPFGGGCRKSRRSRRQTSGGGGGKDHVGPAAYDDPTAASVGSGEIDLAAVYAKYVNPNAGGDSEESYSPGDGSGSSPSCNFQASLSSEVGGHSPLEDSNNVITTTMLLDQYEDYDKFDTMIPNMFADQEMNGALLQGADFMVGGDSDVFELLGGGGDQGGLGLETLWSSGTELQDLGVFSANNDQFGGTSTNLVCDSWGSDDIYSHEIFSRNF